MSSEVHACHRHARISAQKVRLVAEQIRGLSAERASVLLDFSTRKAAVLLRKVLRSAIYNAENNEGIDIDELSVWNVFVDEGSRAKRFRARARGRGNRILKRSCHITVVVSDA